MDEAGLRALRDIDRIVAAFMLGSEITAEEAMEEITAVMDRNSVGQVTRVLPAYQRSFVLHAPREQ
jgi:hypothetical protein